MFFKNKNSLLEKSIIFRENNYCINCGKRGIYSIVGNFFEDNDGERLYCHSCNKFLFTFPGEKLFGVRMSIQSYDNLWKKSGKKFDELTTKTEMLIEYIEGRYNQDIKNIKISEILK